MREELTAPTFVVTSPKLPPVSPPGTTPKTPLQPVDIVPLQALKVNPCFRITAHRKPGPPRRRQKALQTALVLSRPQISLAFLTPRSVSIPPKPPAAQLACPTREKSQLSPNSALASPFCRSPASKRLRQSVCEPEHRSGRRRQALFSSSFFQRAQEPQPAPAHHAGYAG